MLRVIFLLFVAIQLFSAEIITPIPLTIKYDKNKALLGKKLFQDPRLSKDDTISCESCHSLKDGGDDGLMVSRGIKGRKGTLNAPTVFNAVFNISQFWDGRAKDLKEQAVGPLHNPVEMGIEKDELVKKIKNIQEYQELFKAIYEDITYENIVDAIVEFETALITPNSRFDMYLRNDKNVLSEEEKEGYKEFKDLGCISCHNGVLLGGNFYQKIGVFDDYNIYNNNLGRFNVTKKEEDKYFFKVPTLRNISQTSPYLHDGTSATLQETIQIMAHYQLGRELEDETRDLVYKFLLTLRGQLPKVVDEK